MKQNRFSFQVIDCLRYMYKTPKSYPFQVTHTSFATTGIFQSSKCGMDREVLNDELALKACFVVLSREK
jgi:hypothetical protein